MSRISDLGKVYDESLKVLREVMNDTVFDHIGPNEVRKDTALGVVSIYLEQTKSPPPDESPT